MANNTEIQLYVSAQMDTLHLSSYLQSEKSIIQNCVLYKSVFEVLLSFTDNRWTHSFISYDKN